MDKSSTIGNADYSAVKYPATLRAPHCWSKEAPMHTIHQQRLGTIDEMDQFCDLTVCSTLSSSSSCDHSSPSKSHSNFPQDGISSWSRCIMKKAQPSLQTVLCKVYNYQKGTAFIRKIYDNNAPRQTADAWGYFVDATDD